MSSKTVGFLGILVAVAFPSLPARAEVVKKLRAQIPGAASGAFGVENLLGTMRVTVGSTDAAVVVATIHAADDELAASVRLEEVRGENGIPTLRVRYPTSPRTLRYPGNDHDHDWDAFVFFGEGNTETYDGRRYRVSRHHGTVLYAEVEVQVPARVASATFRELVGELEAGGLEGKLFFRVSSADLRLDDVRGEVDLEGSSGDTRASRVRGQWRSDFSSGDCEIDRFEGSLASFHTSSGDVSVRNLVADRLTVETSSGDAHVHDADVREVEAHASSGDLSFDSAGRRLARVRAESSSGDVHLALASDASFSAEGDQSSGDMRVRFEDGERKYRRGELVSFRRGTGGAEIRVRTSSGDFTIDPR
jgi:putative adhesin